MEILIDLLKEINIAQLVAICFIGYFFYNRLEKKIEKVGERLDKLSEKVEDIDRRLCRIEGSLATSGHCLFSQSKPE
jgi:hypothetical protein